LSVTDPIALRGIFDGFEGYVTPSEHSIQSAVKNGLLILDTNVLLNLYRYDVAAREDLFKVLESLGNRLFVPHQVMEEFWRNRENASRDRLKAAQATLDRLEAVRADAERAVREWANRFAIDDPKRDEIVAAMSEALDKAADAVEASASGDGQPEVSDTAQDEVLQRLAVVLDGKVGGPLSEDEHAAVVKEGLRRVECRIPPGFKDRKKDDENAAGDYLLWEQSLREAASRTGVTSIVIVTGDQREDDWYRKDAGQVRGPRVELYDEAVKRTSAGLVMMRPQSLVFHAQTALGLEIQSDTIAKIEQAEDSSNVAIGHGWTTSAIDHLLARLHSRGNVQRLAILRAADNGGEVSRAEVYELGNYSAERTLRGFTRPASRIMQALQDDGLLSEGVKEPLETIYEAADSYVLASGFRVPPEFVAHLSSGEPELGTSEDAHDMEPASPGVHDAQRSL
jgi:predicted nucleic acid-binding protein